MSVIMCVLVQCVLVLCVCLFLWLCRSVLVCFYGYGVATISRLLKIVGLFCRIQTLL